MMFNEQENAISIEPYNDLVVLGGHAMMTKVMVAMGYQMEEAVCIMKYFSSRISIAINEFMVTVPVIWYDNICRTIHT